MCTFYLSHTYSLRMFNLHCVLFMVHNLLFDIATASAEGFSF